LILEAEADLVPMGPRSLLRFGRRRADIPRMSCAPSSAWLRLLRGRRPWVQGLRFASVVAEQTYPGYLAVSAPLRSAQSRHPPDVLRPIFRMASVVAWQAPMGSRSPLCFGRCRADIPRISCGLRSASVVAEQTSPGRLATHLPHGYGRYGAGAPGFKIAYILDQKERSIL